MRRDSSPIADRNTSGAEEATAVEIAVAWLLRAAILLTALVHGVRGNYPFLLICTAGLAIVVIPALILRTNKVNIPVELELVLLWWLVADMTLGRLASLYDSSVWYDKALHLGNSILLGMLAFLAAYVLCLPDAFTLPWS